MAIETEDVTCTSTIASLAVGGGSHNVDADVMTVASLEPFAVIEGQLFSDTMTVGAGIPSMESFLVAVSSGQFTDSVHPRTTSYPMYAASPMVVGSRTMFGVSRTLYDGGTLGDAAFEAFGPTLTEHGTFGSSVHPRTLVRPTLVAAMTAGAVLDAAQGYFVEADTMTLGADTTLRAIVKSALTDTGTVGATLTVDMVRIMDLTDGGTLSASLHPSLSAVALAAAQTMFVDARVVASVVGEGAGQMTGPSAWTANTDNWAMTRYAPFEMASLAVWGGKLYATNAFGLVELAGPTDAGADINARVDSHLTDFKDNRLKLPRAFYLGYQSEQPLTVTMSATDSGEEIPYDYTAPPRLAETFVPDRVPLGRGLRSRFFRYSILNEAGGYFSIDTAFVDADISDRRI